MPRISPYVLSFDPAALERCFLVAEILRKRFDEPYLEYGLIGLALLSAPLHVVATLLLPGQEVSAGNVHQSGLDVLRLRREVDLLSKRMRLALVPISFVHRHPGGCGMSSIDEEFLLGPFVDQVSTAVAFNETKVLEPDDFGRCCPRMEELTSRTRHRGADEVTVQIEYGLAFSLIVNAEREYSIQAARKATCPFCDASHVRLLPAMLRVKPDRRLSPQECHKLRKLLDVEVEAKIRFAPRRAAIVDGSSW